MAYNNPTVQDFKDFFVRDFPYGTDPATSILDQDIANAFQETQVNINQGLFANQQTYSLAYLLFSAHNLVVAIQASSQGIANQYSWNLTSKSVGSVSSATQIPDRILANPYWAAISKTTYGMRYLQMILPQMTGQMFSVFGGTRA